MTTDLRTLLGMAEHLLGTAALRDPTLGKAVAHWMAEHRALDLAEYVADASAVLQQWAAEQERRAVVAWLREHPGNGDDGSIYEEAWRIADAIERGEHLK